MTYTREEIDTAIQAAADTLGEPLSKADYRRYRDRSDTDAPIPSVRTVIKGAAGYGGWRKACRANDVQPVTVAPERAVSVADRVQALRAAAAARGEPLTQDAYDDWRQSHPDAPEIGDRPHHAPRGISGWSDWCVIAGVRPPKRGAWAPLECLYALRLAYRDTGVRFSEATYREWRAAQDGMYPNAGAFRHHWPSFTAARATALGDREEVPPEAWDE